MDLGEFALNRHVLPSSSLNLSVILLCFYVSAGSQKVTYTCSFKLEIRKVTGLKKWVLVKVLDDASLSRFTPIITIGQLTATAYFVVNYAHVLTIKSMIGELNDLQHSLT